jgi:hypothetical protein
VVEVNEPVGCAKCGYGKERAESPEAKQTVVSAELRNQAELDVKMCLVLPHTLERWAQRVADQEEELRVTKDLLQRIAALVRRTEIDPVSCTLMVRQLLHLHDV